MESALPSDPLKFFRDEFYESAESSAERIEVLQNTRLIGTCLSPQDVRQRLVPLLFEMAHPREDPDDEVLHAIPPQLLELADFVGGDTELPCLLPTLEALAQQDETVVRENAVESIAKLVTEKTSESHRPVFVVNDVFPCFARLAVTESFPGRISASYLCPTIYPFLSAEQKAEARKLFTTLCHDETPLVRKAAACNLEKLVEAADGNDTLTHLLDPIMECWKDTSRDPLRVAAILALTALTPKIDDAACKRHVLPVLRQASSDLSWRVRLALVKSMHKVMENVSKKIVTETLAPWFETLLLDQEAEIQASAIAALETCITYLSPRSVEIRLLPLLEHLSEVGDASSRAGLAAVLGPVAKKLGKERTKETLLPILNKLMDDKTRDVRFNCVRQFSDFCEVLESEWSTEFMFESVHLAFIDRQWRIRLGLVQQIPRLAKLFGASSFFRTKWEKIYFDALLDSVGAVRFAAVDSVVEIGSQFGPDWASQYLLGQLLDLYDASFSSEAPILDANIKRTDLVSPSRSLQSYTSRNTLLHALERIAFVISPELVRDKLIPRFLATLTDPIPNVRLTTLRILTKLVENDRIPRNVIQDRIMQIVSTCANEDSDVDVRFFGRIAHETMTSKE